MNARYCLCEFVLLFVATILYATVPLYYDQKYIFTCFSLVLIAFIIYLRAKQFKNYLCFELIFIIGSLILYFIYPLLIYSPNTEYIFSFGLHYDVNLITKGVAIASVGLVAFFIGNMKHYKVKYKAGNFITNNQYLLLFCILLYFIYNLIGGFQYYIDLYKNDVRESTLSTYVLLLIQSAFPLLVFNEFWNKRQLSSYKVSYLSIIVTVFVALHFVVVGSRTNGILLIMPIVLLVCELFKPQSLKNLIVFFCVGIFSMWAIQILRSGGNFVDYVYEWYYVISDFLIPNTNTYLSAEIVDKAGPTYGLSILSQFLAPIPFAQSIVYSLFGISIVDASSSHLFTDYIGSTAGMGTNAVADIYLAFSIGGVILIMFLYGRIVAYSKVNLWYSYKISLIYLFLSALSIYLIRSSIFYTIRFVFYGVVLALLMCPRKRIV